MASDHAAHPQRASESKTDRCGSEDEFLCKIKALRQDPSKICGYRQCCDVAR